MKCAGFFKIVGIAIIAFVMTFPLFAITNKTDDLVFKDGDRVVFIGNSITHVGLWHLYIQSYYQTRFRDRKIEFNNCGIGGNVASDVLNRMDSDILIHKPTVAVIKLGMNDSGNSFYEKKHSNKELRIEQKRIVEKYTKEMRVIIQQLKTSCNPRIILIKPTPYDPNYKGANKIPLIGKNETIKKLTVAVDDLAKEFGLVVVDLYNPLNNLNLKQQKVDSNFTAIGKDRVHPGSMGHLMMAYLFLKKQKVPELIAVTEIDVRKHPGIKTSNSTVADLIVKEDSVLFQLIENALPFPISNDAISALKYFSVNELNKDWLRIKGLSKGMYNLEIENKEIGQFSSEELNKGVNIASNASLPQMKQAQEVLAILKKAFDKNVNLRDMFAARKQFEKANVNMSDSAAINAFVEKRRKENAYYGKILDFYIKNKCNINLIKNEIQQDLSEAINKSRPIKRNYVLSKMPFLK